MAVQNKKKDDELLMWVIGGAIFTLTMIGIDLFYSSFSKMNPVVEWAVIVVQVVIGLMWVISIANWKDPNFDFVRQLIVYVSVVISICVGVHHSVVVEDTQVQIDSHQNATKP